MKWTFLTLLALFFIGCGGNHTAAVLVVNDSAYDTTFSLLGMDVENIVIRPGESFPYYKEFDGICFIDFTYANALRTEHYYFSSPPDAWFPIHFNLSITFTDTGVDFGEDDTWWNKLP